jgi:AcrR family transcriptional regulator
MSLVERREREREARRRLIVDTARRLAEADGWDAVTTRRLSTEIEYSQPVLYKHFAGMDQIAAAVAVDGFGELAEALSSAVGAAATPREALAAVARAYRDFARDQPAVYDAMFTRTTTLGFATDDTPQQLEEAFAELRAAVGAVAGDADADALTEVFWASLHGLVVLGRTGRLRPAHEDERLEMLVASISH